MAACDHPIESVHWDDKAIGHFRCAQCHQSFSAMDLLQEKDREILRTRADKWTAKRQGLEEAAHLLRQKRTGDPDRKAWDQALSDSADEILALTTVVGDFDWPKMATATLEENAELRLRLRLKKTEAERDSARENNREVRAILKASPMEGPQGAAKRVMTQIRTRKSRVDRAFLRVRAVLKRMGKILTVRRLALERALIYLSTLDIPIPHGLIEQVSEALYVADDRGNNGVEPYPEHPHAQEVP